MALDAYGNELVKGDRVLIPGTVRAIDEPGGYLRVELDEENERRIIYVPARTVSKTGRETT